MRATMERLRAKAEIEAEMLAILRRALETHEELHGEDRTTMSAELLHFAEIQDRLRERKDTMREKQSSLATPAANNHTPALRNVSRVRDPSLYHGRSSHELKSFIAQCHSAFRWQPEQFNSEHAKVAWAAQFLEGEPAREFNAYWDRIDKAQGGPPPGFDFEAFHIFLKNLHTDPENRRRIAALQYTNAKQRHNQTIRKFAAYLDELEQEMEPYTETQRVDNLLTRLLPSVRQQLVNGGHTSTSGWTRETLINTITILETATTSSHSRPQPETHRRNVEAERNHNYSRSNHRGGHRNQGNSAHTQTNVRNNYRANPYNKEVRNLAPSQSQSSKKPATVVCFNCNKPGHYSRECTRPKNTKEPTIRRVEQRTSTPIELKRESRT